MEGGTLVTEWVEWVRGRSSLEGGVSPLSIERGYLVTDAIEWDRGGHGLTVL